MSKGEAKFKGIKKYATDLRLDVARLVRQGLRRKHWSADRLAKTTGQPPLWIHDLLKGESVCMLSDIAVVLHALGVKPKLVAVKGKR